VDREHVRARLLILIQQLDPLDRQLMLAYLEGMDAEEVSELTGLSPATTSPAWRRSPYGRGFGRARAESSSGTPIVERRHALSDVVGLHEEWSAEPISYRDVIKSCIGWLRRTWRRNDAIGAITR